MAETTSPQYQDVRALVLSGGVKPKRQAVYIEELGGWYTIQQLMANEKAAVLQAATNIKTKSVDINILYAGLTVQSLRYPAADGAPSAPVEPVAPVALDPAGNPRPVPPDEEEKYQEALQQYRRDLADYQHPYPTDHPHAGEKVFNPVDRDNVSQMLPAPVLDAIAEPAFALSGFRKEDIDEKKASSRPTVIDSTITSLPTDSGEPTLSNS